jgi:hypothetical protein
MSLGRPSAGATSKTPARTPTHNFTGLLDTLLAAAPAEGVTLDGLLKSVGHRSFGPVILVLGFIWISPLTMIPGANWLVATVTLVFSLQMLVGLRHPWLPRNLLAAKFPRSALEKAVTFARKPAHVADRLTAPRLAFLTEPPFLSVAALACILASLATYPLGLIPFGPVLPGLSVVLLGVAVTARDGVSMMLALLALAGTALLLWRGLPMIARGLQWLF